MYPNQHAPIIQSLAKFNSNDEEDALIWPNIVLIYSILQFCRSFSCESFLPYYNHPEKIFRVKKCCERIITAVAL